jgi:hypothetical protein
MSERVEEGIPPFKKGRNFSGSWNISGKGLELGLKTNGRVSTYFVIALF